MGTLGPVGFGEGCCLLQRLFDGSWLGTGQLSYVTGAGGVGDLTESPLETGDIFLVPDLPCSPC